MFFVCCSETIHSNNESQIPIYEQKWSLFGVARFYLISVMKCALNFPTLFGETEFPEKEKVTFSFSFVSGLKMALWAPFSFLFCKQKTAFNSVSMKSNQSWQWLKMMIKPLTSNQGTERRCWNTWNVMIGVNSNILSENIQLTSIQQTLETEIEWFTKHVTVERNP